MAAAGEIAEAGRIPSERIATTTETSDSSTFTTTETEVMSVTASLVDGRTYRVRARVKWASSVAADQVIARMREDNTSGGILDHGLFEIVSTSGFGWGPHILEAEYTASSTGNKTFIVTGARNSGSGNVQLEAATTGPALLYVDYVEG